MNTNLDGNKFLYIGEKQLKTILPMLAHSDNKRLWENIATTKSRKLSSILAKVLRKDQTINSVALVRK
jgi:hypothetical protein